MFLKKFVQKLKVVLENWRNNMAVVYATLIINGKKEFKKVPERLKEQVRQVLIDLELEELIIE